MEDNHSANFRLLFITNNCCIFAYGFPSKVLMWSPKGEPLVDNWNQSPLSFSHLYQVSNVFKRSVLESENFASASSEKCHLRMYYIANAVINWYRCIYIISLIKSPTSNNSSNLAKITYFKPLFCYFLSVLSPNGHPNFKKSLFGHPGDKIRMYWTFYLKSANLRLLIFM